MREEYDFSKAEPNPYTKVLKKQITIRIDAPTIEYFKQLSMDIGMPYQSLINHYLWDCAEKGKRSEMEWVEG